MMKITLLSSFLFVLIAIVLYAAQADALSHPLDIKLPNIDRSATNINNYFVKRKSSSKQNGNNCRNKQCSLKLKPCPKDCPKSCGYLDSPDPCCPLLGKPTCPKTY